MVFCLEITEDEEILYPVPKYERTAFAIDLNALPAPSISRKRTGTAMVSE